MWSVVSMYKKFSSSARCIENNKALRAAGPQRCIGEG